MRALFLALMLLAPVTLDGELQTREPLTIMTFNIRYGTADDGANHWSARKEDLFEIIRREDADLHVLVFRYAGGRRLEVVGQHFWHFNLHLDHQSQPSRERSTVLLLPSAAPRRT